MNEYETEQNRKLFLWKEEEGFIGLIGVLVANNQIQLQHIAINPSHRNQGFGKQLVHALKGLYPNSLITSTEYTDAFIQKCNIHESLQHDKNKLIAAIN